MQDIRNYVSYIPEDSVSSTQQWKIELKEKENSVWFGSINEKFCHTHLNDKKEFI